MIKTTPTQRADAARRYWQGCATLAELAAELGISPRQMWRIAHAAQPATLRLAPWTAEEDALLEQRIREGVPTLRIAAELHRTEAATKKRAVSFGGVRTLRGGLVYTRTDVMRILGVSQRCMEVWQRRRMLVGARSGRGVRCVRLIYRDELEQLVQDRRSWIALAPSRITDAMLRDLLLAAQATANGRWLTTREVAERFYAAPQTVVKWVQQGLPHERFCPDGVNSPIFIWSADVAPWLAARPGSGWRGDHGPDPLNATIWQWYVHAGATAPQIAEATGLSIEAVRARIKRMKQRKAAP